MTTQLRKAHDMPNTRPQRWAQKEGERVGARVVQRLANDQAKEPALKISDVRELFKTKYGLTVSRATLHRWMETQQIKHFWVGGQRFTTETDIAAFIAIGETE
jgi:hypothetical protein